MFRKLVILIMLEIIYTSAIVKARVSGPCANCHTMHNSQNNLHVSDNSTQRFLLRKGCVSCHTGTNSPGEKTPYVYDPSGPVYNVNTLAGGNFYWVLKDSTKGHNCLSIPGMKPDENLSKAPGFHDTGPHDCQVCHGPHTGGGMYPQGAHGDCSKCHNQISSCQSCHKPAHHAKDTGPVVGEEGGWYRFLISPNHPDPLTGVKGIEDEDWELTKSSSDHNEYMGSSSPEGYADNSISHFCAGCHGYFHGISQSANKDGASPWLRHPTNIALPSDPNREYYHYNNPGGSGPGNYNPLVPIARDPSRISGMSGPSAQITPGSDQVMCLSCHRAHGSPYPDMMRWDYSKCKSGASSSQECGCIVCHTSKGSL